MSECPDCGMRDDDWFLCRRDKCAIKASEAAAAYGKGLESQIARLQEQVETLKADAAFFRGQFDDQVESREAAEAERDRLREALDKIAEADFEQSKSELHDFVTDIALAALQKEPQP